MSEEKGRLYVVKKGDWLSKIARRFKLPGWETIWDHEKNAQYKKNNRDPNLIYPGDEFWIPGVALDEVVTQSGPQKKAASEYTVVRRMTSAPFIQIFRGTVQFVRSESFLPRDDLFWQTLFEVVIVKVKPDCTLSMITKKYFGREYNENDDTEVAHLYSRQFAEFFERSGIVGEGSKVNFPKLYERGQVPLGYEESSFNPNVIYEGQCIFLRRPVGEGPVREVTESNKPLVIEGRQRWQHKCWLGPSVSISGDFGVAGKGTTVSCLFNVADLELFFKGDKKFEKIKWVLCEQGGGRLSGGWGGSIGLAVTTAYGFSDASRMDSYESEGYDFVIALGWGISGLLKSVGSTYKAVRTLKSFKILKALGKTIAKKTLYDIVKNLGKEFVVERINTGPFKKPANPGICSLPIPFASWGLHVAFFHSWNKVQVVDIHKPRFE